MTIQQKDSGTRGMFFIAGEDGILAEIVYSKSGDNTLIIEHTEVDESMRGQNIGYELVHKTVDWARTQGMKVSPVCPFAKALFDKKPEWRDVLV